MRTIGGSLKTHMAGKTTTLATCWRLTRADGVVMGFTDHDRALLIDGVSYEPASGMTRSALSQRADLSVGNSEVSAILESGTITEVDLNAGKYDNALVVQFICNWADLTMGGITVGYGRIGNITVGRGQFVAELRGLSQNLQQTVGERYSRTCRADLGDARCGVALAAYTVTGTVTAVTSNQVFTDSGRAEAAGHFNYGLVTWIGGNNAGLKKEVKAFAGGAFTLFDAMRLPVQVGDTYSVYAGCNKLFETCKIKFANAVNFRGEPHIPGIDSAMKYPDAQPA